MTTTAIDVHGEQPPRRKGFSLRTVLLVVVATALTTLAGVWVVRTYIFPKAFRPVELSTRESSILDDKIGRITAGLKVASPDRSTPPRAAAPLEPTPYSEAGASREIAFTEKEVNALLARNTNLAERLAIDLSSNLASARLLIPMEQGFPVVGGKVIRIDAGLELAFTQSRPVVILRGVSVMGVPVPQAWLGNLKNVDLVQQFGSDRGFWQSFADGVELIEVADGTLRIKLKE